MTSSTFCLVLHTHLPFVLNHGRWPHGSDWLNEAALECYLPLLATARQLTREGLSPKWTVAISPVLAEQLASPHFRKELEFFLDHRLQACQENREWFRLSGETSLAGLADYWEASMNRTRDLFREIGGDLLGAFSELERVGHLEIMTCAATHGYLPLLSRDESIRLQLRTAVETHRTHFGRQPRGIWLPECAYRSRGDWAAPAGTGQAGAPRQRAGIEELLSEYELRYFVTDAHLVRGGQPLSPYKEYFAALDSLKDPPVTAAVRAAVTPYHAYRVASPGGRGDAVAFVRDPETTRQVWRRDQGYPGDPSYLEFHKKHFPGGLRYWRVTDASGDLGGKATYDPGKARERARAHAEHFSGLVSEVLARAGEGALLCAPFDAELFGHWWFEGPDWLGHVTREIGRRAITPMTLGEALEVSPPRETLSLTEGSWGEGGDHRVWVNKETQWTWEKVYQAERELADLLLDVLSKPSKPVNRILAQACRQMLLLEASDWQFLITTWAARDYAERRLTEHFDSFSRLAGLARQLLGGQPLSADDEEFLRHSEEEDFLFAALDPSWTRPR
jgi:1,4-alpha-glucan branching enzyme